MLVLLEIALRVAGYGYSPAFFERWKNGEQLIPNRRFAWQFGPREMALPPYPVLLPTTKPPQATRIFILGESAALGTPDPAFGFGRILETMLRSSFPSRRFEIVNVAMRGINSHVVLPIARDCSRRAPDLFLIYMGNNEAIGMHSPEPHGFHRTAHLRLLRLSHWIRATRLAQASDALWRKITRRAGRLPAQDMAYFRQHSLPADHPRRQAIYDNFRINLEEICQETRASGAKVILSTVAVNLTDFPPLASLHRLDLMEQDLAAYESAFAAGTNAEAASQFSLALQHYREAAKRDDHLAELHFRMARCLQATGQRDLAEEEFASARDWDALAFRADRRLNQIVRDVASHRHDPGLLLLDAERALAANSAGRTAGPRFFHDHVHFTFDGDYQLARAFVPLIAQALGLTPIDHLPTRQQCAEAMAFTEWDEISVASAMLRQTARPPFLDQLGHAERQAAGERALETRARRFQENGGLSQAIATYRAAIARHGDDWQLRLNFGSLLSDFENKSGALSEYQAAVRLMPAFPSLRLLLAQALASQDRRAEALQQCREALHLDPDYGPAREALAGK